MSAYTDHATNAQVTAVQVAAGMTVAALAAALNTVTASRTGAAMPSRAGRAAVNAPVLVTTGVSGAPGQLAVSSGGSLQAANEGDWIVTFAGGQVCVFTTAAFNARFS